MAKISQFDQIFPLIDEIKSKCEGCASLEAGARTVIDVVYEHFRESLILTRIFATIPYGELPEKNRAIVDKLTHESGVADAVNDATPILSLLATRGLQPGWNDRHQSRGHVGIPLVSDDFVDRIPMIARLLSEVGLELSWLDPDSTGVEIDTLARLSGLFYVEDAATAVDGHSRKIIAAQDFVLANDVKTVFGLGGGFAISKTFLTLLFFCNEHVDHATAKHLLPLISTVKAVTSTAVTHRAFFD